MKAHEIYCLQLLRERAYELYFSILFAPAAKRGALAALYAFQLEILHIGEQVREPLLGEMRLQWWHENLESCVKRNTQYAEKSVESFGNQGKNAASIEAEEPSPILIALAEVINRYNLPLAPFFRLCEAARFDLYQDAMPSCAALEDYCNALYGAVLQLACRILGEEESGICNEAYRHGGIAQGLAVLMRHLPRTIRHGKFYIPADILASIGIDRRDLEISIAKQDSAEPEYISAIRKYIAAAIFAYFHEHYKAFTQARRPLPANLYPAFLPLAVLPAFVRRAEKRPENIFAAPLIISPLVKQIKIGYAAFFNRF